MKIRNPFLFLLTLLIVLTSCNSDDDSPVPMPNDARKVLIGNEGSFNNENASLTLINLDANEVEQNIFAKSNDDAALGDILQSMTRLGDEIYLIVNNSAKIEVVHAYTFERKRTISIPGSSPRFMVSTSEHKAYVSDLFASGIHIIDPSTGTYIGMLELGMSAEQMVLHDGKVYATCPMADSLIVIDPTTDEITGGVGLSTGVDDLRVDNNGMLWTMADGNWDGSAEPAVDVIDPITLERIKTFEFPSGTGYNGVLEISRDGTQAYLLAGGNIYRMDISADAMPTVPWITANGRNFHNLIADPATGDLFVTDAVDYTQSGKVYVFNNGGQITATYAAGIAPNSAVWISE